MKSYVISLLESYPVRKRRIALLHYEMQYIARILPEDMIGMISLGHSDCVGGGSKGRFSDKTMYIMRIEG